MNGLVLRRVAASACVIGVLIGAAVLSYMLLDGIAQVTTLALLGTVFAVMVIWQLPKWQAEAARDLPKDKSRAEFENEARKTVGEVLGGLLLILGLAATWLQVADSRQEQRDTAVRAAAEQQQIAARAATEQALAREGQLTDRFTTAVDQLGSPSLQVRLAGIYALEGIAHDSPEDAPAIMELLTAFVRKSSVLPLLGTPTPAADQEGRHHPQEDIQAVLTVIERGQWKEAPAESLPECLDLSRTDLRGVRFGGTPMVKMCLADADLTGADLTGAYLDRADLQGAVLKGARLEGAQLAGADLRGADLELVVSGCIVIGPDEEKLCTNLGDADLRCRSLVGGEEHCTNMRGIQLWDTDLTEASLAGADIGCVEGWSGTDPQEGCASLGRSNLTDANMVRVDLKQAHLLDVNLTRADLKGTTLTDAFLREVNLKRADLEEARLTNAYLYEVNLTNADLSNADLSGVNLLGGHLTNANLYNSDLSGGALDFADLTDVNLSRANLSETSLNEANLTNADLSNADLSGAYLEDTNLTDANLFGANLSGASLVGTTRIESANLDGDATPNLTAELKGTPAPMTTPVPQSRAMLDTTS